MLSRLLVAQDEIEEELACIENLHNSLKNLKGQNLPQEVEARTTASILVDFYMLVEKVCLIIAKDIDGSVPMGDDWHKQLLRQMVVSISNKRPPVITRTLFKELGGYLRFRHLVRNIYGFRLDQGRYSHLIDEIDDVSLMFAEQITDFLNKMRAIAEEVGEA